MQAHLRLWCDATGMLENAKKREGMLLGRLRRHPERAPMLRVIANDAWAADGDTIRALSVPMGNYFDEAA